MILKSLSLKNFRNHQKKVFNFSPSSTLIIGPNTSGKTNILEAIYFLSTGHSFRADLEKEVISYNEEISRIEADILDEDKIDLEIVLTTGEVVGQQAPSKKYLVNGVPKRMIDFVGSLRSVLFWPEDLDLVTDSPSLRRKYLDLVLCQVDREYRRCLLSYEKGVRQRNKLLERIREAEASRNQLLFWNQLLIKNGRIITDKREEFINFINGQELTGVRGLKLEYDKSIISQARIEQYGEEEVAAAATLVGPHRDDYKFLLEARDLSVFGSRGEQRLAVLWLKMSELEFISQKVGKRPVLLLDDIFSELDKKHRELVTNIIPRQQTIITATDIETVRTEFLKEALIIRLGN